MDRKGFTLIEIMIAVAIIGVMVSIAIPNFAVILERSRRNACIVNLRQINNAKAVWALQAKKVSSDTPAWRDLVPEILQVIPECSSGGTYTIGAVNEVPTCTIKTHVMVRE